MTNRIQRGDLQVSEVLDKLISEKVLYVFNDFIALKWWTYYKIFYKHCLKQISINLLEFWEKLT